MKILISLLVAVLSAYNATEAGVIRLGLKGEFHGESTIKTFDSDLLIPIGEKSEIFIPPYTLTFNVEKSPLDRYLLNVSLAGLGPEFRIFKYDFDLAVGEKTLIPSLPVKNESSVMYSFVILDDSSRIEGIRMDPADTLKWGMSTSIHYLTRWMRGSLADFTWNTKMGYLENIYDQYRYSYKLSMFEKIDLTMYPEITDAVYMDPNRHYAILPNSRKIDLVYGHAIDAATPSPAAELLIYRLWGYGPRWMVTGLAHYYDDNDLKLRNFAGDLDPSIIENELISNSWVESDTGSVFCGGFVNWLMTTFSQSSFNNLYRESTPFDFKSNFKKIYDSEFSTILKRYLKYVSEYEPKEGELQYYASIYLRHNDYHAAAGLLNELATDENYGKEETLSNLAACRYWGGEYERAKEEYDRLLERFGKNPRYIMLKADAMMALGEYEPAVKLYESAFTEYKYGDSGLRLVGLLADEGKIDSARAIFDRLDNDVARRLDYDLEKARLDRSAGIAVNDTILIQTATRALSTTSSAPDDPRGYLAAGRAFMLLGQYDKAQENLNISFFLERKPYFSGLVLLELGKTADLRGRRNEAKDYYEKALKSGGGKYIEKLSRRYIDSPFKYGI